MKYTILFMYNILMISLDYPPVPGGISAHVKELAKAMADSGNNIWVITRMRPGQKSEEQDGLVKIYRLKLRFFAPVYGLQVNRFTKKILSQIKPDIIHIHGMMPLEWYNINHIPLAYTNHTSGYLKRIKKGGWRRITMLKRHFKKTDLFLAPSRELLEVPFQFSAIKRYIANGVDGDKFLSDADTRKKLRKKLGYNDDDKVAIITRRLVDKNGVIFLARAASLIQSSNVHFLLIGDGPERAVVEKEFKKSCQPAKFLGNKTHDQIVDYYKVADFSILPSLMEATSISGLEAMASSLPLVGTNVGGIPELISDGINGFLCQPASPEQLAEKIDILLSKNLSEMGAESRKMVEKDFTWSQIARKTCDAYGEILS